MITLKNIETKEEQKKALNLYKTAFPKEEQKPWKFLLKKQKEGLYKLLIAVDEENNFYGLAFTVKNKDIVLLDFLAISPEFRGQGIGSKILKTLQENKQKFWVRSVRSSIGISVSRSISIAILMRWTICLLPSNMPT